MNENTVEAAAAIQNILIKHKVTLKLDLNGFPTLRLIDDETGNSVPFVAASRAAEGRGLFDVRTTKA